MPQAKPALKSRRTRLAAASTSAALVAGVGGLVLAGAPAANATNVTKTFSYTCTTTANGLPLPTSTVPVKASVDLPTRVAPGQTLSSRSTAITLTIPETLRKPTYELLSARKVSGYSRDASVAIAAPGAATQTLTILNLGTAPVPVPATPGTPWNIPTRGTVPAVKISTAAKSVGTVSMPVKFTVRATLYNEAGAKIGSTDGVIMNCSTTGDRTLAKIAIGKATAKIASAKASPKKIKAKKTKAKVAVRLSTAAGVPLTGKVTAKVGKKTVGKGTVRGGKATLKLKAFKKKGTYKVKLTYSGSASTTGATKTIKIKVKK
ncbi:hypothetical protein FE697_003485 [Mumia zhuanghuii]|uniref:DUF6801 domain-containing protein n=2 Tax=Mumia TaxID=1546255 RepID=A0ABW1QMP4_9ACTN|nr:MULTISPECIES: DUF6801 domain-containing protein [Mumia]KAA1424971.1 hypothetical protein FE697_003485 [Mumia zhuanghuii]